MTADATVKACLAALNARLTRAPAYEIDQVPTPRPHEYVEVGLSRRFGGNLRVGGQLDVTGYRLTARAVSKTSVNNVRTTLRLVAQALEFQSLTVGTRLTTPIQFETEDPPEADDGWFSGLTVYTFTL